MGCPQLTLRVLLHNDEITVVVVYSIRHKNEKVVQGWVLPDPVEQFSNPYLAMGNNPVVFIDPDGRFIGKVLTGIGHFWLTYIESGIGLATYGWEGFKEPWSDFDPSKKGTPTNNAWRIDAGRFKSDPDKKPIGRAWQVLKRNTWQYKTTMLGNLQSQGNNIAGNVDRVDYFHGSTVVYKDGKSSGASSVGGYITMDATANDGTLRQTDYGNHLLLHEYGHYLQEQTFGPLTLHSGINSGLSSGGDEGFIQFLAKSAAWWARGEITFNTEGDHGRAWFEQDANSRARNYFQDKEDVKNFQLSAGVSAMDNFNARFPDQKLMNSRFFLYLPPLTPFHIIYTAFFHTGP